MGIADARAMLGLQGCIVGGHDLRLVLLAGFICLFACFSAFGLLGRVRRPGGNAHLGWLAAGALVAGSGVWATHFVAMLAFHPSLPLGYDVGTTLLSIVIAVAATLIGLAIAFAGERWILLGGAIVGAAIGAMHFVGMSAVQAQAEPVWDGWLVAASLAIAIVFSALAMRIGMDDGLGLRRRLAAATILAAAICGLHFTAMAAVRFVPDPRLDLPDAVSAPAWLAVAVAAVALMIVAAGLLGAIFDQYLAERAEGEAIRLRAHVQELEAAKGALEATTRDLEKALVEAAAASQAKSHFLATMSHELRTPLNAIIGFAELLAGEAFGPLGNRRYRQYATDIHGSGTHLLAVINDVLDFSKLDAGKLVLDEDEVELGAVVGEAVQMVRVQAASAGLGLVATVEPGLPRFRADRRRLRQILINLLSNAVKFTPSGGEIRVVAAREGDELAIVVADTGIGIAPEDIPKALERFGQVDGRLARNYEGTGLGLPFSKSLVELHGGRFGIESAGPGTGTRVTMIFPAARFAGEDRRAA
jgi:signal transduction histidine kinase